MGTGTFEAGEWGVTFPPIRSPFMSFLTRLVKGSLMFPLRRCQLNAGTSHDQQYMRS
jgi:hypothetical protein